MPPEIHVYNFIKISRCYNFMYKTIYTVIQGNLIKFDIVLL